MVVDDGSPNDSIRTVAAAQSGVRYLRLPRTGGFCAAANAGIRAARGRLVELLNDDTEVTAGWASAGSAPFADPRVAAVAPLVLLPLGQGARHWQVDSAGDRYYVGGVARQRGHGQPLDPAYLQPRRVFGASGSSAFYRRSALLEVGLFPETFGAYFEDVDLSFRLHRAGYHIVFEPASRVIHQGAGSYGKPSRRLLQQSSYNEERVFWRNLPASVLPGALARHGAVLAAKAWRRWEEGDLVPFLFGRLGLLKEIPGLIRHRRFLQRYFPARDFSEWEVEIHFVG
jgi:GT2 family glycosyltransferase